MVLDIFSFPAIAGLSELQKFPKKFIESLYKRFDNIIVYYNNDLPGIKAAKLMNEEHGISYIVNPTGTGKDPSDLVKKYGLIEVEILINKLIYGTRIKFQ